MFNCHASLLGMLEYNYHEHVKLTFFILKENCQRADGYFVYSVLT